MDNLGRTTVNILGIKIDSTSTPHLLRKIQSDIRNKRKFFIVTPNPEQIMLALKDNIFLKALNSADIAIPDGVGLVAAYRLLRYQGPSNKALNALATIIEGLRTGLMVIFDRNSLESDLKVIRGRELFMDIVKLANKKGWKVFLLGGLGNEANGTREKLEKNYKNIRLMINPGPVLNNNADPIDIKEKAKENKVIEEINGFSPQILFVGMGNPRQEKWLYKNLKYLKVGGSMVVGGTYRYIAGKAKLPPKLIASMGMEWMWRLFTGSQRLDRIISAVPSFAWTVLKSKLQK